MFQLKYQMSVFKALRRCKIVGVYFKLHSKICTNMRHFYVISLGYHFLVQTP